MGSAQEPPVHKVGLDAFWIDQTEMTNARFAAFLNEQGNQVQDRVEIGSAIWRNLAHVVESHRQRTRVEVSQSQ